MEGAVSRDRHPHPLDGWEDEVKTMSNTTRIRATPTNHQFICMRRIKRIDEVRVFIEEVK